MLPDSHFRACAIIPVYNHPAAIGAVVAQVRGYDLPVILVDDGSEPACAALLKQLAANEDQITLLRLDTNSGKGCAVLAGARAALALGYSHGLQIDADGQHDASAIPAALGIARRYPRALVAGVPQFDASIPAARLYGRWFTHIFVWLNTWSFALKDALCGFRVYPLAATVALANRIQIGRGMEFDIDIGVRLMWDNVPVKSVCVAVSYPSDGVSHFDLLRDNLRISRTHTRLVFGMLIRIPLLFCYRLSSLVKRQ